MNSISKPEVSIVKSEVKMVVAKFSYGNNITRVRTGSNRYRTHKRPFTGQVKGSVTKTRTRVSFSLPRELTTFTLTPDEANVMAKAIQSVLSEIK